MSDDPDDLNPLQDDLQEPEKGMSEVAQTAQADATLTGLFERYPNSRFWAYLAYAALSLLLSIVAALIIFGRIPDESIEDFQGWIGWSMFSLNLVGVAFGFTAATNVFTKRS